MTTTPQEKTAIIKRFTRSAQMYVNRTTTPGLTYEDREEMQSDCLIAVSNAVDSYDESRGVRLDTYISKCMRNAIASYLRANGYIQPTPEGIDNGQQLAFERTATMTDPENATAEDDREYIDDSIMFDDLMESGLLTPREITILKGCEQGYTYREIGAMIGVTKQRIEQVRSRAIKKLRGLRG